MSRVGWWSAFPLVVAVLAGAGARMYLAPRAYSEDVVSYALVAEIMATGGNVYAETHRYNYGPIWFHVLEFLAGPPALATHPLVSLHVKVTALLTLVDAVIACMLWGHFGRLSAVLFMLHPISIIITGLHAQFDNLAIALGLASVLVLESKRPVGRGRFAAGVALLGVSLIVKHVLFALPLWLAFRNGSWKRRAAILVVPPLLFLLSLAPYWQGSDGGILRNVFLYRSEAANTLWSLLPLAGDAVPAAVFFLGVMVTVGWFSRKLELPDQFLLYLPVMVAFGSGMANQYLAIPLAAVAARPNLFFAAYTLAGACYLAFRYDQTVFRIFSPGGVDLTMARFAPSWLILGTLALGAAWFAWTLGRGAAPTRDGA